MVGNIDPVVQVAHGVHEIKQVPVVFLIQIGRNCTFEKMDSFGAPAQFDSVYQTFVPVHVFGADEWRGEHETGGVQQAANTPKVSVHGKGSFPTQPFVDQRNVSVMGWFVRALEEASLIGEKVNSYVGIMSSDGVHCFFQSGWISVEGAVWYDAGWLAKCGFPDHGEHGMDSSR